MSKESTNIHGLAASIRSATSNDTFDLGGLPPTTISQVIRDAFSRDFDLDGGTMIRITLVVGAGKGNRSKYDPAALKLVTKSLTDCGYIEDRGASCVIESAGCFKFQHDTGKNLKTVVLFPKLSGGRGSESTGMLPPPSSLLPPNSLEFKIAVSTVPLFNNMLKSKFPSWMQKRALLRLIDEKLIGPLNKLDAILIKGGLLSEDETFLYEQCVSVTEKKGLTKDAMSQQVQDGKLTALEVNILLDQVAIRIKELQSSKNAIPSALQERQAKLQSIAKSPISPPPLKHHVALAKLWKQAAPMMYLNTNSGKLLTPAETKKRGQLEDILCEISDLEKSCRGLLEDDESWEERIRSYRRGLQEKYGNIGVEKGTRKQKYTIRNDTSSSNRKTNAWNSTTNFQTPVLGTKGGSGWMSSKGKKSKSRNKGDLFGAMMADSDSDSDEEEGTDSHTSSAPSSKSTTTDATNSNEAKDMKKKSKKKKKKKRGGNHQNDDDAFLDEAVAANNVASEKEKKTDDVESSNAVSFIVSTIMEVIIPFILTIVMWFVTLLFGKNKNTKRKKR